MLNQENTFEYAATSLQYAIALSLTTDGRMIVSRFDEAFKLLRELQATETLVYASGLSVLGAWYVRDGRHKEGIDKMREALAVLARLPATEKGVKSETQAVRCELAAALITAGDVDEGEQICTRLLEETGDDNVRRGQVLVVLARAKLKGGKKDEARDLLRQTVTLLTHHVPGEPLWLTQQKGAVPLAAAEALLKEIP
jgi:tetratricopeptide (TPR) repeat protein